VDDGSLAYPVVTHRLAGLQLEDDRTALGRAEEDARDLTVAPRYPRCTGSRLPWGALLSRRRKRDHVPAFHGDVR
jgi:hypothetical protein